MIDTLRVRGGEKTVDARWKEAEEKLKYIEAGYTEIGRAGMFALLMVISPLRERFNQGERTDDLWDEINTLE